LIFRILIQYYFIRLGLDKDVLAKLINSSTGQCWSSQTYNPCPGVVANVPSSNDYNGGFASELMIKDLSLALGNTPFFFLLNMIDLFSRGRKRSPSIYSIN
jgi:hypothetical protein